MNRCLSKPKTPLRSGVVLLLLLCGGCSSTMQSDFECRVPNKGVCDSLGEVNHLVDSGYFEDEKVAPTPNFGTNEAQLWVNHDEA